MYDFHTSSAMSSEDLRTHRNSILISQSKAAIAEASLLPVNSHHNDTPRSGRLEDRESLLGKVVGLLNRTILRSRENSVVDSEQGDHLKSLALPMLTEPNSQSTIIQNPLFAQRYQDLDNRRVIETKHVSLEYDPASKRKILNTYEILREIGRGEHGKVKLARNLLNDELVAIKIVSRRSKDRLLRMRRPSNLPPNQNVNDYEAKIRREINIMKRCNHKYIVKFKEVLDDKHLHKIYLVLEYMERGEIMWKRQTPITEPRPIDHSSSDKIPCRSGGRRASLILNASYLATEDNDLLSYEFSPNLTFRQSRRVFRDVLLGLEYLHMQGIVHRDIKPANLLVSSDYTVKISDFGVSFASSLKSSLEGDMFSDMELAKTVGTPAFFAPELCQTSISNTGSSNSIHTKAGETCPAVPKVNHKIDIWALGVTLYCLLFGRVPFNADSEFALFDVIVNSTLEFPESNGSFNSPQEVSVGEFELAKDLLTKMLAKNSAVRIDIEDIKNHDFVLCDIQNDPKKLDELFFLNSLPPSSYNLVTEPQTRNGGHPDPAIGIAKRINGGLLRALDTEGGSSEATSIYETNSTALSYQNSNESKNDSETSYPTTRSPDIGPTAKVDSNGNFSLAADELDTSPRTLQSQFPTYTAQPRLSSASLGMQHASSSRKASLLLHDVFDFGRRDSAGSLEAPQIETKRNVGGDLYLKNQSAIDAFKDIQKSDKKIRKSSIYSTLSHQNSVSSSTKALKDLTQSNTRPLNLQEADTEEESLSKIKVGPISINAVRRPSSVISLPLTESFASLDSDNDDYLSQKYQEFRTKKQALKMMHETITMSDSVLLHNDAPSLKISEKFQKFSLGTPSTGQMKSGITLGHPESIGPRTQRLSSMSSSCESESDEDLTLNIPSKVTPLSRPAYTRATSHESNLSNLPHLDQVRFKPFMLHELLHELEDVPEDLLGGAPNMSSPFVPSRTASPVPPAQAPDIQRAKESTPLSFQGSPLKREVSRANEIPPSEPQSDAVSVKGGQQAVSFTRGHFNNHYKKESRRPPFPFSKHLDLDRESQCKLKLLNSNSIDSRPSYNRSNSITLGLLQHERSDPK